METQETTVDIAHRPGKDPAQGIVMDPNHFAAPWFRSILWGTSYLLLVGRERKDVTGCISLTAAYGPAVLTLLVSCVCCHAQIASFGYLHLATKCHCTSLPHECGL